MMRKWFALLAALLLFSGCAAPVAYETVSDELLAVPEPQPKEVTVGLPSNAVVTIEGTKGKSWLCEDYTVCVQTFSGGDFAQTVKNVTGLDKEDVFTLQTLRGDCVRYELAWVCAGEGGEQLNRAVMLDDGFHHYVLSIHGDADSYSERREAWRQIAASFDLSTAP